MDGQVGCDRRHLGGERGYLEKRFTDDEEWDRLEGGGCGRKAFRNNKNSGNWIAGIDVPDVEFGLRKKGVERSHGTPGNTI